MGRRLFQRRHFFKEDIDYQQAHETVRHCFPGAAVVGNLPANAGDEGDSSSIPGSGRSPGVGNVNLLQYSCLENPMDRGAWQATVHGVTRVGHDLVTKPPNHHNGDMKRQFHLNGRQGKLSF